LRPKVHMSICAGFADDACDVTPHNIYTLWGKDINMKKKHQHTGINTYWKTPERIRKFGSVTSIIPELGPTIQGQIMPLDSSMKCLLAAEV